MRAVATHIRFMEANQMGLDCVRGARPTAQDSDTLAKLSLITGLPSYPASAGSSPRTARRQSIFMIHAPPARHKLNKRTRLLRRRLAVAPPTFFFILKNE